MDPECPYLKPCPMFRLFSLETTKRFYIGTYCRGRSLDCARRKLRDAGQPVPDRLLPDGQSLPDDSATGAPEQ